jgi:hypothetical protein
MRRILTGVLAGALLLALGGTAFARTAQADVTLNVVHGIPGVDVNVCVNGNVAIPDFNPGEVVTGVALPAGTYDLKIVGVADDCSATAILEATDVELRGGKNYTAVANLMEDGTPTLSLFTNNVKPVEKGTARLTVRHTAAAPEVDVWANGAKLLTNVPNGASATLSVPKGVYAVWVSLPGDYLPVIGPDVLKLAKGSAYEVYAWGSAAAGYAFAVVATPVGTK